MNNTSKLILLLIFAHLASAQDMYLEYKTTGMPGMEGTNKMYVSSSAGLRMDMEMTLPKMGKMTNITVIPKGNTRQFSYNSMSKTYYESTLTTKENPKETDLKVELVGKEKVNGYNCTHIKITMAGKVTSDMWTTKDIPGYEVMETLTKSTDSFGSSKMYNQLKAAGAGGLTVKMQMNTGRGTIKNELVKAEKRSNPASLYALPAGYKKMDIPNMPGAKR